MENELYHYGRKGMKWGMNIFGKKRSSSTAKTERDRSDSDDPPKKTKTKGKKVKTKPKKIKDMTDEELNARIKRLQLEKNYRELNPDIVRKKATTDYVADIMKTIGKNTLVNVGSQAATHYLGEAINKAAKVSSSDTAKRIVNPQKGQSDKK